MTKNKVILMYGRFSETIDGIPIIDMPLCNPSNEGNWMGWTKKELEKKDIEVYAPQVTKVWEASYDDWKKVIEEIGVDEHTTLVGLSAGAAVITRYIVEEKKKIHKLIMIAPAGYTYDGETCQTRDGFYDFKINAAVPKQIKAGVTIFYDPKDDPDIVMSVEMYAKQLNANIVSTEGYGHFSFLIPTFPPLLDEILANLEK